MPYFYLTLAAAVFIVAVLLWHWSRDRATQYYQGPWAEAVFKDPQVKAYFQHWGQLERAAKTQSAVRTPAETIAWYQQNLLNFTSTETDLLNLLVAYLPKQNRRQRWKFVKIHSRIEFGYPFTLGEYIFLPHRHLQTAVRSAQKLQIRTVEDLQQKLGHSTADELKTFIYILAHERVHVHQRRYLREAGYTTLYRQMGFSAVPKELLEFDRWIDKHRVTNPDDPLDLMWLVQIDQHWYLPLMIIETAQSLPVGVLVKMLKRGDKWVTTAQRLKIDATPKYKNRFQLQHGLYSPNEILAYLVADLTLGFSIANTPDNTLALQFIRRHAII